MKNLFVTDENSGVLGMLTGLVVIVFVALALSLLMYGDVSLPLSGGKSHVLADKLQSEKSYLDDKLTKLKRQKERSEKHLEQVKLIKELNGQIESAEGEIGILNKLVTSKQEAIEVLASGKKSHREKYRDHVRANALGRTYESVTNRLGKTYHDARITSVTPVGVSISHRHGAVRLEYGEMPREWQKELMYTAQEFMLAKRDEEKMQNQARNAIDRRVSPDQKGKGIGGVEKEIMDTRRKIAVISMKLASVRTEARLAAGKVSEHRTLLNTRSYSSSSYRYFNYGSGSYYYSSYRPSYRSSYIGSKSVPGSLETWEQRVKRFQGLTVRYQAQLNSLRLRLHDLEVSRLKR